MDRRPEPTAARAPGGTQVALGLGLVAEIGGLSPEASSFRQARLQLRNAGVPFTAAQTVWLFHAFMLQQPGTVIPGSLTRSTRVTSPRRQRRPFFLSRSAKYHVGSTRPAIPGLIEQALRKPWIARSGSDSANALALSSQDSSGAGVTLKDGRIEGHRPKDAVSPFLEKSDVGEGQPRPQCGQRLVICDVDAGEPGALAAILGEAVRRKSPDKLPTDHNSSVFTMRVRTNF